MRVKVNFFNLIQCVRDWFSMYHSEEFASCVYPLCSGETISKTLDPYSSRILVIYKKINDQFIDIVDYLFDGELYSSPVPILKKLMHLKSKEENQKRIRREPFDLSLENANINMDLLMSRIHWIISSGDEDPLFTQENYWCMMILLYVGVFHPSFHAIQLEKERTWFIQGLKTLLDEDDQTSFGIIGKDHLLEHLVNPTTEDLREYYIRYPDEWFPPKFWYEFSFTELPSSVVDSKVMYEGGKVHINRKELAHFWWRKLSRKLAQDHYWDKLNLNEQYMFILERIVDCFKKRFKQSIVGTLDIDIEDMPPCIRNIAHGKVTHASSKKSFPSDSNRMKLVRVLAKGGVSLLRVEKILEDLNTKYPHSSGNITLKKRWDYEAHYKKGYAPPKCDEMGLLCPFTSMTLDKRKMKCHQQCFKEKHPDKYDEAKQGYRFYGPTDWFKWIGKKK